MNKPIAWRQIQNEGIPVSKLGPNDACWCGSGKKYKKCHMAADRAAGGTPGASAQSAGSATALKAERKAAVIASAATSGASENRIRQGTVSPKREVPAHIPRPEYAGKGKPSRKRGYSILKTPDDFARARRACQAARRVLNKVLEAAKAGVTTDELDQIAHEACIAEGGYPSPLDYGEHPGKFPKSLCTSVNEVICHGIPDSRKLEDGDIVNCDITIYLDGYHGDNSETVMIGEVDEVSRKLVEDTKRCMEIGIEQIKPGNRIFHIGKAIEEYALPRGYGIVRSFLGHGVGRFFHMDPQVPHHYDRKAKDLMVPGMVFTVEPMITLGSINPIIWADEWTAVTDDYKRTAQFEQTCLVTETGVEVLTATEYAYQ